jgi:chaperonin GroEL
MLQDIAILTGANLIATETGRSLKDASVEDLGRADMVRSTKDETVVVGGKGAQSDIDGRVAQIEAQIEKATSDFDKEKMTERKAKLTGGVAVIQVGAASETEMKNLQERVKDAKEALKAAIDEGIIPGGGVTYIQAGKVLQNLKSASYDEGVGVALIKEVLEQPLRMLARNSGVDEGEVIYKIKQQDEPTFGFNVITNEYGDMIKAGVIEPAKVAMSALQFSESIGSMILTTDCLVTDVPEDKKAPAGAPDMGGMM